MNALKHRMLFTLIGICFIALATVASSQTAPDPGLVGQLTSKLGVTPAQATGGAGAIFGLAKTKLSPAQFSQLAGVVPGMDKFLAAAPAAGAAPAAAGAAAGGAAPAAGAAAGGAAPAAGANPASGIAGAASGLGGSAASAAGALGAAAPGGAGGLASLAGSFQSLGLSPATASKFVPIMQNFVGAKGGPGMASMFAGALK